MSVRHTQTLEINDEDVPGLPELYPDRVLPAEASEYVKNIYDRFGEEGLVKERDRLLNKVEVAASYRRHGTVGQTLDKAKAYIEISNGSEKITSICRLATDLDKLQGYILEAQRLCGSEGKVSVILHLDEENWDKYGNYSDYIRRFE